MPEMPEWIPIISIEFSHKVLKTISQVMQKNILFLKIILENVAYYKIKFGQINPKNTNELKTKMYNVIMNKKSKNKISIF